MATDALDSPSWSANARSLVDRESVGALVLAVAIPFLFMHERFQPELAVAVGSTSLEIRLADWAVLAVVAVALITAVRRGTKPLAAGRLLWISGALLIGWLAFAALRPVAMDDAQFDEHLVSYLKFVEYALLAVAVPLVVRRSRDLTLVLLGVVLWSAVATGVALLQLLGSDIFSVSTSGWRYASFLGRHDLAALSALAASLARRTNRHGARPRSGDLALSTRRNCGGARASCSPARSLPPAASRSARWGCGSPLGIGSRRRAGRPRHWWRPSRQSQSGVVMIRSEALDDFLRFVGLHGDDTAQGVETYSQRTVLAYIGLRIAQDNPIVGVGWQRSSRPEVFEPYVDDARERFPDVVDLAFPTEENPMGRPEPLRPGAGRCRRDRARAPALRRGGGARARVARGGARTHAVGCGRRARRRLRAPHARGGMGVARHRCGNPAAGCDVPAPRARRSGRGGSGECAGMKTLVTGGGGFIGSNLVRALLARGDDVRVLDNFSTGSRRNLAGLDVEVVEGELRSYERVHNAVRGTEVVFHLGALGSVPRSVQDPLTSSAVNVEGTLNVQLAARDEGVRRVVFASSSSIYGNQSELPLREAMAPDPISPYGVAKLAAERYCVSFSRVYHSFETVVLRYFNVFGPRQDPTSQYAAVVPLFITAIAAGEPVTIFDDGEQSRDFTYVDNVVAANLLAADAAGANGRIFNISGGTPTSVNELAVTIGRLLGKPVERRYLPARPGDLRNSWADVSEARSLLGFEPQVELEEGLRRTADYLLGGKD